MAFLRALLLRAQFAAAGAARARKLMDGVPAGDTLARPAKATHDPFVLNEEFNVNQQADY